jgi:4,5-dihydroxyphthalate decarboxylase
MAKAKAKKAKSKAKAKTKARVAIKKPAARPAPGKLKLTIMTGPYESVRALLDGTVQPKGIRLEPFKYPGGRDIHTLVATGKGADINEFNGGQYCIVKDQNLLDVVGIPVFLHRRFRHGFIFINRKAGINSPKDLIGRRIGMNSYGPAAHYWMRGHLEHDFGVPHRSMTYVLERKEDVMPKSLPADLKFEYLPKGSDVEKMLLAGELDVIMAPNVMREVSERDPRVGHLWENYVDVEKDYFRRTGIFPIMHITTLPRKVVDKHPWVVESLTHAFEEAKQLAYKRVANPRIVPLAWFRTQWEEERHLLGRDPWEYGLSAINRKNYDALAGFTHEQGVTSRRMTLEDLFCKEAFELETPLPRFHEVQYDF